MYICKYVVHVTVPQLATINQLSPAFPLTRGYFDLGLIPLASLLDTKLQLNNKPLY